tara:strand:- start:13884 stop:15695 length:1812 start_codon:yes stop_codon:yes gene_type:complete
MKNKLIIAIILSIGLTGCEQYLDKSPDLGLSEDDVFAEFESARGYLDQTYNMLEDFHIWNSQGINNLNYTSLSDETAVVIDYQPILQLIQGQWFGFSNKGEIGWDGCCGQQSPIIGRAFASLRISNKIIENAEEIPSITQDQLDALLGQAYFFRAWWYFQIIQRWGGMPIFDRVYNPSDDLDFERLTYQESSEWIITNIDKAITMLPDRWDDVEYGRVTKGAALGLKSMVALYASSPLMKNGLNSISNTGYDISWSERTAAYANDAINYVKNGTGGNRFRFMDGNEYEFIFYYEPFGCDEALWFNANVGRRNVRDKRSLYIPRRINNDGGQGDSAMNFSNPTQDIVDLFETADGYPIDHPNSLYDPQKPYDNRDPRFYNDIFVPGEQWGVNNANKPLYLETYVGGLEYNQALNSNSSANRMITGYANKKFNWPEANGYTRDYNKYNYNHVYIRVSQLYLDYAEAMNEAYGPNSDPKGYGMTAVQAINIIRNRVNMPNVLAEFTGSKELFRERIRNERSVELMFEHPHRWNDIRRWMIAEDLFKEPLRGMRAHPLNAGKPKVDFDYEVIPLITEQRVFEQKHYWYPIANDDVDNLNNLQQNPGW